MLSHRTFFLFLAIVAGLVGLVGTIGIVADLCEFLAVVFLGISVAMVLRGKS